MIGAAALVTLMLAPPPDALADCRKIPGDAERLACYDALSGASPVAPDSAFGQTTLPKAPAAEEPRQIDARLAGRITGWRKGTLFTLDNGQVWKSVDDHREEDLDLDAPAVSIRRNFVGHYWMTIEGGGPRIIVIRVQ